MIYWIQEATIAGAQGATPSWLNALLGAGVVGAVVGFIGLILAQLRHTQILRQTRELEDKRARETRELEDKRAHEAALQRYFEHVGNLLVEQPLRDATLGNTLRSSVAQAQTLAVLEGLDPDRKRILLQFLYESHLVDAGEAVISLAGANLTGANLRGAILVGAESLTQEQIYGATGDENTKLPDHLQRPAHWSKGDEG